MTGDTVNTAARLQAAAPVGGVLIGETTALAVADVAELGRSSSLELKGKAEPTQARVVTGVRAEPSREQAMGELRAPTLGRDEELATLLDAQRADRQGATERWLIVAPPGVGKSRLLRELADQIGASDQRRSSGDRAHDRTRSRPSTPSPDCCWTPGSRPTGRRRRSAQAGRSSAAGATEERAAGRGRSVPVGRWPPSSSTESAEIGRTSKRARVALRRVARRIWTPSLESATQVWLIEDVHWAGGDVLAFIDYAAAHRAAPGRPAVIVVRPGRRCWRPMRTGHPRT